MNNEIKVNLNIILPGRVMLSEQVAQNKPKESYDSFSMEVLDPKKQDRERITVKVRKSVPAKQVINLSVDAYETMISKTEVPYWVKANTWVIMSKKQRLETHLQRITEALGGITYTYKILED